MPDGHINILQYENNIFKDCVLLTTDFSYTEGFNQNEYYIFKNNTFTNVTLNEAEATLFQIND